MGAPTKAHEQRIDVLRDMAAVAGLVESFSLGVGLEPDVALRRRSSALVLVGDAKATETPGCAATSRRLSTYAWSLIDVVRRGVRARLVLAVPTSGERITRAWCDVLAIAAPPVPRSTPSHARVDESTTLIWLDLVGWTRTSTMSYSSTNLRRWPVHPDREP